MVEKDKQEIILFSCMDAINRLVHLTMFIHHGSFSQLVCLCIYLVMATDRAPQMV